MVLKQLYDDQSAVYRPATDLPWEALTNMGQVTPIVIPPSAVSGTTGLNGASYTRGVGRIVMPSEMTMVMLKEDERTNSGVSETNTVTSITVANGVIACRH